MMSLSFLTLQGLRNGLAHASMWGCGCGVGMMAMMPLFWGAVILPVSQIAVYRPGKLPRADWP
jgi:hypothetical protein